MSEHPTRVSPSGSLIAALALSMALAGPLVSAQERARATGTPIAASSARLEATAMAIPAGTEPIKIDGELAEEIWAKAPPVSEFLQRAPSEGAVATHPTEARILFDQTSIYIAVRAIDPEPDRVVGLLTRRDDGSPSDWFAVLIDSYHDRRSAFEFGVNAAGVKYDTYWFNDTNNDRGWDAVWDVAAQRSPQGWRAEFRIPFSQLRFKAGQTDTLGLALVRTVAHINETSTWPLLARSASGYVSSFGELKGVTVAPDQKKLELMPYALAEVTTAPVTPGNPFERSPDPNATVGLDLKYRLAPGLTLTGTINPDFGQVEADPAVVNLGAFETFFPERRPFFVEGSGNFAFNIDCNDGDCSGLFYSRRIGRAPHRSVTSPEDGYVWQPVNSTILGAAKLTGRIGSFSVGALNAVTANEEARIAAGPSLDQTRSPIEPASNYAVVRASREFEDNSRLSFMMTSTNRRLVDELRFLPGAAVTGGVDSDMRMGSGRYSLRTFWAGSTVRGSADAIDRIQINNVHSLQRPDATHVTYDPTRTSLNGHAGSVGLNKISGQRTRFSATVSYKSPGFEINDLGFQPRADEISNSVWFQIRSDTPGEHFRNRSVNFNQWGGWNFGGDRRSLGFNVNTHWTHVDNWGFGTGFNINTEGFNDRLTRGGPGGYGTSSLNQWGYFDTDGRKRVSLNFFGSWFNDRQGSFSRSGSIGVTVRASTALSVRTGFDLNYNRADTQWVENLESPVDTHYVFGRIDQKTSSLSIRVNYTIRPTLTLQLYGQPFVSAGDYSNFKELVDGRADRYADRYDPFLYLDNPDFNYRSFRTTNVLRWEYRPGSALFVVWQQGREDTISDGSFRLGRDFRDTFNAPATSVFLVKISRWLNF